MNVLTSLQIQDIVSRVSNPTVDAHNTYFTMELPSSVKLSIRDNMGLDLSNVANIPMRWIVGDMAPHVDVGSEEFQNTYLIYLTDSEGEFILENVSYPIRAGQGFVFNEGLRHETRNTGSTPRLLIGPMSETGLPVGIPVVIYYYGNREDALIYENSIGNSEDYTLTTIDDYTRWKIALRNDVVISEDDVYNSGDNLASGYTYYMYPYTGGDIGGDPQIRTLYGDIYTVPDYLKFFDYIKTKNTLVQCSTKILTEKDFPTGVLDHNGIERINLGPFDAKFCPHTYMDKIYICDKILGNICIDMDTLYTDYAKAYVPLKPSPMKTPLRAYPTLSSTKEIVVELTDLTLHLWSDTTLLERHNIHCIPHVPYNTISGAITERPILKFQCVPSKLDIIDFSSLNINGVSVPYSIAEYTGSLDTLTEFIGNNRFVTEA